LLHKAIRLSTDNEILRSQLIRWGLNILERNFSSETVPALLATRFLREMKVRTGCRDPFETKKRHEMDLGKTVFSLINTEMEQNNTTLLKVAAVANSLDHFQSPSELVKVLSETFSWAIYHGDFFWEQVYKGRGPFLYLADNAGEAFFDLPLFQRIRSSIPESYYVIKGGPVQNDLTLEDLCYTGLYCKFSHVITHGLDSVGLDVPRLDAGFKELYQSASLILAKGMGHFETLCRIEQNARTLFLLKAKCIPVAESLGVQKGAYVALMQ
jgi:hypothetical protein